MLSTTLDNVQQFDFDQTSLDKAKHARLHWTRWPNCSRHFTQHECRALYSKKSRAFGRGLTVLCTKVRSTFAGAFISRPAFDPLIESPRTYFSRPAKCFNFKHIFKDPFLHCTGTASVP